LNAPEGWVAYQRPSRYLQLIGPLYEHTNDPSAVRILVDERHTNARGFLHAGLLVAIADTIMGHTIQRAVPDGPAVVTVSLTTDFTGSAHTGDWLEGHAVARRCGTRLSFAACDFHVGDRLVFTASGVFAATVARAA
jgi:acyl-coenzyme A thioesterase 13